MKRAFTFLLALILALALVPVSAAGEAKLSVSADKTALAPGDEVELTVSISGAAKCLSVGLAFDYDTEKIFTIKEGVWLLSDTLLANFDRKTTPAGTAAAAYSGDPVDVNGDLFRLTLIVKDDAPLGEATVKVTPTVKNSTTPIPCTATSIDLTVEEPQVTRTPGDVDGQPGVTVSDLTVVAKYLAGWQVTLDLESANVDGQPGVTVSDLTVLAKYLAGWQVTLQ